MAFDCCDGLTERDIICLRSCFKVKTYPEPWPDSPEVIRSHSFFLRRIFETWQSKRLRAKWVYLWRKLKLIVSSFMWWFFLFLRCDCCKLHRCQLFHLHTRKQKVTSWKGPLVTLQKTNWSMKGKRFSHLPAPVRPKFRSDVYWLLNVCYVVASNNLWH